MNSVDRTRTIADVELSREQVDYLFTMIDLGGFENLKLDASATSEFFVENEQVFESERASAKTVESLAENELINRAKSGDSVVLEPESHVMSEGSVTHWIQELKEGVEGRAQEELWKRYFHRLVALARSKLKDVRRGAEDEEDVALSALNAFFDRVRHGHFPRLNDRDSLWPLLAKITARRAINQRNKALAQKRGGGKVRGESAFLGPGSGEEDEGGIAEVVGYEPTPAFAAELTERCDYLLSRLSWDLRLVARLKLEGYTNKEIATELGRVDRTVERKLDRIRAIWSAELNV